MTDRTAELLPTLQNHHLPGLNLGDNFIYPHYVGRSILNIPSSVCRLFGVPGIGAEPLAGEYLDPLGGTAQRVILVLMDALALHRLQRWMMDGTAPVWNTMLEQGLMAPITSITPSTTSAALTALWTGRSAAEHGITGYEMWLKEYGVVANTILHAPITFQNAVGSLAKAGFKPQEFLVWPTMGTHLAQHGIKTYALQHRSIIYSGLSQMFFKDVNTQAFHTAADLWINMRHLLEDHIHDRLFAWVYWSEVDHFGHIYGPDNERTSAEFAGFSAAMERLFLDCLSPEARKDTVLILTADHGQIATPQDKEYELRHHAEFQRNLHISPTGENRLAYLYLRPGHSAAAHEYLERTWPDQFAWFDPVQAVEVGLFGPGEPHPRLFDRLGDVIVAARDGAYLWWADKDDLLLGRHGGLHPDEMLVPFLAARLPPR